MEQRTTMSPELWMSLPEDVLRRIVAKLPFSCFIEFRAVCKRWNAMITSPEFPCPRSPLKPVLLNFYDWELTLFNSKAKLWQVEPLPFTRSSTRATSLDLVASAGGLLCFETEFFGLFIVCNPITKRWKEVRIPGRPGEDAYMPAPIPSRNSRVQRPLGDRRVLVGLVVDPESGHYKLVVAGVHEGSYFATLVYNSLTCTWKRGAQVPQGKKFFDSDVLSYNGRLYCLVKNLKKLKDICVWKLLRYDVEIDTWRELPLPDDFCSMYKLVEHCGQVLLLTENLVLERYSWRWFFQIFEIHDEEEGGPSMSLSKKDIPLMRTDRLREALNFPCDILGQGDVIYTTRSYWQSDSMCTAVLVIDFSTKSYSNLSPLVHKHMNRGHRDLFHLFTASLSARV